MCFVCVVGGLNLWFFVMSLLLSLRIYLFVFVAHFQVGPTVSVCVSLLLVFVLWGVVSETP